LTENVVCAVSDSHAITVVHRLTIINTGDRNT